MADDGILHFEGAALDCAYNIEPSLQKYKEHIDATTDIPLTHFVYGNYANDNSNWYIPNCACLKEWLLTTGFTDIEIKLNREASRAYGWASKDPKFKEFEYSFY